MPAQRTLRDQVIVITGASRGIGLAIAKRCAIDSCKIAILAKTTEPHPTLPGTIHTAAQEISQILSRQQGACSHSSDSDSSLNVLAIACDVRDEVQVQSAIEQIVNKWGRIDILVNNASAISLTSMEHIAMRRYDLMHSINGRGTFLCSKLALPHLKKSKNAHILNMSPPLNMDAKWFENHTAYTMSKYNMSMCTLGLAEELKPYHIAVNSLWPRTSIATAAVSNVLGGDYLMNQSRTVEIVAEAAYHILTLDSSSECNTGQFFIDDQVLNECSAPTAVNLDMYHMIPGTLNPALDFFVEEPYPGYAREQKVRENGESEQRQLKPIIAQILHSHL